jgi:uncharacterized protein YlzI (FlbEa/FlbD family)
MFFNMIELIDLDSELLNMDQLLIPQINNFPDVDMLIY